MIDQSLVGVTINDRYLITDVLGEGGLDGKKYHCCCHEQPDRSLHEYIPHWGRRTKTGSGHEKLMQPYVTIQKKILKYRYPLLKRRI